MIKYKLLIEYDGTEFVGWQKQNNGSSIQESIEKAIYKLTSEKTTVHCAGRTDAGVHAIGQVAHFELEKNFNVDSIRDGVNQHLRPLPIAILKAADTNNDFHSRFSAKKRTYEYKIVNRRAPLAIDKKRVWNVFKKLDLKKMQNESKFFLGKHDFSAFRSIDCQSNSSIKTIETFTLIQKETHLSIIISARSFLHSQVRIMVGTLVEIGKGKISKSINDIISSRNRSHAGITAPAHGLYLIKVDY